MYNEYIHDILNDRVVHCQLVRLSVERHVNDLERSKSKGFAYRFDADAADRVLRFFRCLTHTSGEWASRRDKFQLAPFQAFRLAMIFGWKKKASGHRRFTRAYVEIARKNGKTEEAAGVMLYGLLEGEAGAQVYSAATTRDQARICWRAAQSMASNLRRDGYKWAKGLRPYAHSITNGENFCKALSADANTLDGLNPHFAVIDEFHAHPSREVLDVIETGVGSRSQPLVYIITTAGFNTERPAYHLRKTAIDILRGDKTDESFFTIIYTLDDGDDWQDEANWIKANPNIGNTPKIDFMREQYVKAVNEGAYKRTEFLTKNLNVWTNQFTTWIPTEKWTALAGDIDVSERECFVGLDLAATSDYNAACFFYPDPTGAKHYMRFKYWLPSTAADKRGFDMPAVLQWADTGHLTITEGNVVDYQRISDDIMNEHAKHPISVLAFDRAFSYSVIPKLFEQGLNLQPFSQAIMNVSSPTKEFERMVLSGSIAHDANPVTTWMLANVAIFQDGNGNIRAHKGKSTEKIDGIAAAINAVGQWMTDRLTNTGGSYLFEKDDEPLYL
jgi:phage terminase large subunit-like protein